MKLKTENVSRMYFRGGRNTNYFYAVRELDFSLEEGCVTVITGRSGSGKTTLINMLGGLLTPSEGKVLLDEQDLYSLSDKKRSLLRNRCIGMIPQGQTGLQSLTVSENVMLPATMYGKGSKKTEMAAELLEKLGIDDLRDVYSNELSGGELRRMSIARALINEPEIIIADEPTADLDADTTVLVMELLKARAKGGSSVLIVTHDKDVLPYADIVMSMEKGVLTLKKYCTAVHSGKDTPPENAE